MLRVSKLGDYGTAVMAYLAMEPERARTAAEVADEVRLAVPTVRKLLKILTKADLLCSRQGVKGGYRLARAPREISVAQVIQAIDGKIALTECSDGSKNCVRAASCGFRAHWQKINQAVYAALAGVSLAQEDLRGEKNGGFDRTSG
ncbi:MAG: SUF system Fe-S cluster assembly regulator [Gammaproteobacteria bacterium]|nr:SUF system Fe-S cluster assembly regulator [Gammaproteobacteria bacterium]